MPPKRRTSGPAQTRNSAQQQSQQRISFGKGAPNRVTKPTAVRDSKKVSKKGLASLDIITPSANQDTAQADELIAEPTTAEKAIQEQVQTELQDPLAKEEGSKVEDVLGGRAQDSELGAVGGKSGSGWVGEEEVEARKVTETRIKAYWRAKERERKAPRVHQEGLTVGEKVLREWDMSGQYGVSSSSLCRTERY